MTVQQIVDTVRLTLEREVSQFSLDTPETWIKIKSIIYRVVNEVKAIGVEVEVVEISKNIVIRCRSGLNVEEVSIPFPDHLIRKENPFPEDAPIFVENPSKRRLKILGIH